MQENVAGTLVDADPLTGYCHKGQLVVVFKRAVGHALAHERTAWYHVGGAQLTLGGNLARGENEVVGIDQSVRLAQVQNLIHLARKHQSVVAHQALVGGHRRDHFAVETHNLNETATRNIVKSGFGNGLPDVGRIGRHEQLRRVVRRLGKGFISTLALGQESLQGQNTQNSYGQAEESRNGGDEDIHGLSCLGCIHP